MGVKGINELLKEKCLKQPVTLADFRGKTFAVDGNLILYKLKAILVRDESERCTLGKSLCDESIMQKKLEKKLLFFTIKFMEAGITPVYVFDGKHKSGKIASRSRKERKNKKKGEFEVALSKITPFSVASSSNNTLLSSKSHGKREDLLRKVMKLEKDIRTPPTYYNIHNAKKYLHSLGVPTLTAFGEGEKLCSYLAKDGIVDYAYSNDGDCHAYGCPNVVKPGNNGKHTFVKQHDVLRALGLSQEEFVECSVLAGCDYNHRPAGWSFKTAMAKIKEYGTLEKFLSATKNTELRERLCIKECLKEFCERPKHYMFSEQDLTFRKTDRVAGVSKTFYLLKQNFAT